jgi:peptidylprolyl isomerase
MKMRRSSSHLFATTLALALLGGCGSDSDPVGPQSLEQITFHPSLGIDLAQMTRTDSGLYYKVLEEGTGSAVADIGDSVTFGYKGWFHTGVQFTDSSVPPATPFNYIVGNLGPPASQVITGVDQGITGMRVGETRLLVIPWELAYGAEGSQDGRIPNYANLVFEVTIIDLVSP